MVRLATVIFLVLTSALAYGQAPDWVSEVGAREFPSGQQIFRVKAKSDTSKVITKAIQAAIDQCAKRGGGIVTFAPGTYVTGAIFLKAGVHLRIDRNVSLLGSTDFGDYPEIDTRIAGIEMKWPAALINVMDVRNAAVTGEGTVDARGKFCWDLYWRMREEYVKKDLRWIVDYDVKRVRTFLVQNASDVTLKGLTFKNAGFWTVQLLYSQNLTVDGVTIRNNEDGSGPSTDGIDVDSSSKVLIENCDIDCNDDNFCLKAGRDWDGLRVNRPTEYVVIRNCVAQRGAGLVTLGSETSGGIRHIYCTDLSAKRTDNGLRIKSATTRGGVLEDVHFVNVVLDSVRNAYQFNLNWYPAYSYSELPEGYDYDSIPAHWKAMLQKVSPPEKGIPAARDFYISNVKVTHALKAFEVAGLPSSNISGFHFTNSAVTAQSMGTMEFIEDWKFDNFTLDIETEIEEKKEGTIEEQERLK